MDFKGQGSANSRASQSQPAVHSMSSERGKLAMENRKNHKKVWIISIIVVVALIVIGGGGWWAYNTFGSPDGVKKNQYQAVFLTNGQVYFGKLSSVNDRYINLTDIYYLQVQQSVQPGTTSSTTSSDAQVSLAQLGGELHGPDNQMYINRDQVLFWENLKDNGKVVEAIKSNQNK